MTREHSVTVASARLRATDIALICYDFDGVMTDNKVLLDETGREAVFVNRADGLAVAAFKRMGMSQLIVSTEINPVVAMRGQKLKIPVLQGLDDKAAALRDYAARNGHDLSRAVFIGNDVNDLGAMMLVGWPVAPADAHPSIKAIAKMVTAAGGGQGVIREFFDLVS